eukprot:6210733-Pleurochrysis_carterae.AAC.1
MQQHSSPNTHPPPTQAKVSELRLWASPIRCPAMVALRVAARQCDPCLANQMLAQLEKRGLVENLGEAFSNLVACTDEVRLDRAIELALAEVVLPVRVALRVFLEAPAWSAYRGFAVELGANDVEQVARKIAEEGVSLIGSNTASSSLSLARTGSDFEELGAPVYGTVDKDTQVRYVGVVGLSGCVGVDVEAMVA